MTRTAATWNVNSVRARMDHVLRWLEANPVDLLFLQETKVPDPLFPADPFRARGYIPICHGQKTYNGVAVLCREEPEEVGRGLPSGFLGDQARLLILRWKGIRFLNAYVPNGGDVELPSFLHKLQWLDELLATALSYTEPVLILGDFNVAPGPDDTHSPETQDGTVCYHPLERERIRAFLSEGFVDVFRRFHREGKAYSWWDYRGGAFPRNLGMRLDLALASRTLAERVVWARIDPVPRRWEKPSDHAPLVLGLTDGE